MSVRLLCGGITYLGANTPIAERRVRWALLSTPIRGSSTYQGVSIYRLADYSWQVDWERDPYGAPVEGLLAAARRILDLLPAGVSE